MNLYPSTTAFIFVQMSYKLIKFCYFIISPDFIFFHLKIGLDATFSTPEAGRKSIACRINILITHFSGFF